MFFKHLKAQKTSQKSLPNLTSGKPKIKKRPLDLSIPESQVYWQGWVRYYHYPNNTHFEKPPSLFQNNAYYHQRVPKTNLLEKDQFGSKHIPNKASFFLVLYNDSLALYSERKENMINMLVDSLRIEDMDPVPEDDYLKGSVKNSGEFGFGSCLEILAWIPTGRHAGVATAETWILCTNSEKEKFGLQKRIAKLKIKDQRTKNGNIATTVATLKNGVFKKKHSGLGGLITNPFGEDRHQGAVKNPSDGYWVMLNDWTKCNRKCGGGVSFQQWMCVPPKDDGLPCSGNAIKTKKCNEQACPSVNNLLTLVKNKKAVSPKPIIQVGAFSNRPQRYSKCFVKENDAFTNEYDVDSKGKIKKPVRIVMNNHTISVFKDDQYEDLAYTFDLQKTTFVIKSRPCCYVIRDNAKKLEICSYDSECDKNTNAWAKQWEKDFHLFKYECHTGIQKDFITEADEEQLEDKMNNDLEAEISDNADSQALDLKKQQLNLKQRQYDKKKKDVQEVGFKVISKEIELEDMVQNEEKEKEELEEKKIQKKLELEKKKQACLEKTFEEKELDDEFIESEKGSLNDTNEIKLQTAKKIEEGRFKLRRKIQLMKNKAKARQQQLNQELTLLRSKMSKEIILANRNGNWRNCQKGKHDNDYRETYCNNAFPEDWYKNSDCKADSDFCYACCENEFGLNFVTQRDNCYDMCDQKPKPKEIVKFPVVNGKAIIKFKDETLPDDGHWQWAPRDETNNKH